MLTNKFIEKQKLPTKEVKLCSKHNTCSHNIMEYKGLRNPNIFYIPVNEIDSYEHFMQHDLTETGKDSLENWYKNIPPVIVEKSKGSDGVDKYTNKERKVTKYILAIYNGNHRVNTCVAEGLPIPAVIDKGGIL